MTDQTAIPVHSIQEEHLYVLLQRCGCGHPYELVSQSLESGGERPVDRITGRCQGCAGSRDFLFDVGGFFGDRGRYASLRVNPTPEPSRAIDLEGWTRLALFYLNMIPQAEGDGERTQTTFMAAQCIEEALKFFPPGEAEPGQDAFFSTRDPDRRSLLCGQETFRVSYLRELRGSLPKTEVLLDQVRKMAAGAKGQKEEPGD